MQFFYHGLGAVWSVGEVVSGCIPLIACQSSDHVHSADYSMLLVNSSNHNSPHMVFCYPCLFPEITECITKSKMGTIKNVSVLGSASFTLSGNGSLRHRSKSEIAGRM